MANKYYSYIAFEAPFGCQKRELARKVATALNAELIPDIADNPFIDSFYKKKEGASFQAQLFFLLNRYQKLQSLKQPSLFHQVKISDFIMEKDRIYAYQNLSDSELNLYEKLYPMLTADMVKPDLVVYLQMSVGNIMENLKKRRTTRDYDIPPSYVENVVEGYNRFFFHYKDAPLIIVNVNNVNFERNRSAFEDLLDLLQREQHGVSYFSPLAG